MVEKQKISEYDMICILEIAFPGITCKEAREAIERLKKAELIVS